MRNPVQEKTREYLLGLEDKRFMDEIVAVYLRVSGNPNLEAKLRETLDVSCRAQTRLFVIFLLTWLSYFAVSIRRGRSALEQEW